MKCLLSLGAGRLLSEFCDDNGHNCRWIVIVTCIIMTLPYISIALSSLQVIFCYVISFALWSTNVAIPVGTAYVYPEACFPEGRWNCHRGTGQALYFKYFEGALSTSSQTLKGVGGIYECMFYFLFVWTANHCYSKFEQRPFIQFLFFISLSLLSTFPSFI